MKSGTALKIFCVVFSVVITLAAVSAAPYSDYDNNIRDLYEMLMQKDEPSDHLGMHQVVRKSSRGPQLRLRFGKRPDAGLEPFPMPIAIERPPSIRLRFGKRSEDSPAPISAYMAGISSEGEK